MYILGYPLQAGVYIIDSILFVYTIIVIASVVVSWLRLDPWHPALRVLRQLTHPIYRRVRPYLPRTGAIDLAPLAVLLFIMFIQQGILPIFYRFASNMVGNG